MKRSYRPLKLILFLAVISAVLYLITGSDKDAQPEVLSGFVSYFNTDSKKHYRDTLINYYDPEVSWKPGEEFGTSGQPLIIADAGLLVDINTGKILYSKNPSEKLRIASLTKIMTAVIALEHKKPESKIYVSSRAAAVGENTMGLTAGEVYTLEELLYGLILSSGNDSAYAISEGVAGDTGRFVEWMNLKASELGLKDTYFACPSGLDDDTYSTATDLVKLTRYALKNPTFRKIAATVDRELIGDTHKYVPLENQTNLLTTYPGVAGVKTGYTGKAGLTLVTFAVNEGHELVGVALNTIDRKGDMVLMLDHGFGTLGVTVEHGLLDQ